MSAGGTLTTSLLDTPDRAGHTALQLAARAGRALAAAALLDAGAAASLPDPEGWTPLRAAAWAGHTQVNIYQYWPPPLLLFPFFCFKYLKTAYCQYIIYFIFAGCGIAA